MASQGSNLHIINNAELEIKKKKLSEQQKREALQREVSMLQKMLDQEEKMQDILRQVHDKREGSAISIPNFLPPKVKELLAELAMVDGEIARLETQIGQLQQTVKHEQEATKEAKSKRHYPAIPSNSIPSNSIPGLPPLTPLHPSMIKQEKMAFETKALHFISKAIKGDYTLNDFKSAVNEKTLDQKENQFQEEAKFQDRIPRKSGLIKPPSPLRDFRHPSPSPKLRERIPDTAMDLPPRSLPSAILSDESNQNWHPNKLSENVMKCLNFIYVRLLRTSRAIELEKSGPISRSTNSSLLSRSFRVETSSNSKSGLLLQKESRQQDPYGIFDVEESIPRDIGPYKNLVIFSSSNLDQKCIASSSSIPLLRKLRVLMSNLETVDLKSLNNQQKLAFWINMYNACIMHGYLQFGVPNSPEKFLTLMNKATLNVGGNIISAQAIEHYILRKPGSPFNVKETAEKDDKEAAVRKLYGLESMDPNVTFALCCGTRSSPAVRIYTPDGIVSELDRSKLEYLQASVVVTSAKKIAFPELLLRNMFDFATDMSSLVQWVCHQLPTSGTLRKSMVDCFRGNNSSKIIINVEKVPYDFEFQDRKSVV